MKAKRTYAAVDVEQFDLAAVLPLVALGLLLARHPDQSPNVADRTSAHRPQLCELHAHGHLRRSKDGLPRIRLPGGCVPDRLRSDAVTAAIDDLLREVHFFPLSRVASDGKRKRRKRKPPVTAMPRSASRFCESRARITGVKA